MSAGIPGLRTSLKLAPLALFVAACVPAPAGQSSGPVLEILVIVALVLLNAVFVAAEIALVTVRRTRVEQLVDEGRRGAARVRHLIAQPGRFLAVIQLGITFIGFLAAAFAGASLAQPLEVALAQVPFLAPYAGGLALIVVTAILSFFTIVFGELVPKTLALAHPERYALALAGPVDVIGRVLRPIVWALERVTNFVNRLLGIQDVDQNQISTEELKLLVERGGEQGILEAEEEQMIHAVIELGDRRVHEVMVPRIAIVALAATAGLDEAIDRVVEEGHSRIPVYEETVDEIVGILYAKDLLPFLKNGREVRPNLRSLLRTPVFVPESMSIDDLLHELQRRKVHIAIVLDEYGGTAGLVTIEDLLEEIVGEIQDEYDVEEPMVVRLSEDEARVDGRAAVDDLAEIFDTELGLEDEDEYDTVGGLIYHRIGGIPSPGDQVEVDGLLLTVESTDGRRVGKVLVVRRRDEDGSVAVDEADR
jgi:putative hemolysin